MKYIVLKKMFSITYCYQRVPKVSFKSLYLKPQFNSIYETIHWKYSIFNYYICLPFWLPRKYICRCVSTHTEKGRTFSSCSFLPSLHHLYHNNTLDLWWEAFLWFDFFQYWSLHFQCTIHNFTFIHVINVDNIWW